MAGLLPIDTAHRSIEAARIHLGRRHQSPLDHRDALADFELAQPVRDSVATIPYVTQATIATIGIENGQNITRKSSIGSPANLLELIRLERLVNCFTPPGRNKLSDRVL